MGGKEGARVQLIVKEEEPDHQTKVSAAVGGGLPPQTLSWVSSGFSSLILGSSSVSDGRWMMVKLG